ncbi:MAG TPA: hypothetical protein V6C85_17595, partial [Allocoleopsis sp.]
CAKTSPSTYEIMQSRRKGVSEAVARNERQHLERKILVFASNLSPKCFAPTASWDLWVMHSPTREGGWGVRFSEFANSILKSQAVSGLN